MATRSVRFYFDYVSPNAYLAWTRLPALAARHGVAIEPVPVLFARRRRSARAGGWDGWSTLPRPSATRSREKAGT